MIETLNGLDISITTALNSLHNQFFDNFMWLVSATKTWIILYLVIIALLFIKNWKQAILIILMIALCIAIADQISSGIIKNAVERLRPSRNPELHDIIHIVNDYRGGLYGFVSSHAANTFALIFLLSLIFRKWYFYLAGFSWATIISYSRIYLGVHFLGDILGGVAIGLISGYVCYVLYKRIGKTKILNTETSLSFSESYPITIIIAMGMSFLTFAIISYFML